MIGRIVCSLSGRDAGKYLVVVKEENGYLFVCDGKERPLERPKAKNPRHLFLTDTTLEEQCFLTNKLLRKSLAIFKEMEELKCLKKT